MSDAPEDWRNLDTFSFGDGPELAEELALLVLAGKKTATCWAAVEGPLSHVGERMVMITFIESQIPDQMQRDLFYTLNEVRALEGLKMEWSNRMHLERVLANLLRMWSR